MKKISKIQLDSPLGEMEAWATELGVCLLAFIGSKCAPKLESKLKKKYTFVEAKDNTLLDQLTLEMEEYFNKERTSFDVPLDLIGTDFQIGVWNELLGIPFGDTRTYKDQSIALGDVKAIRAVASANGANNISIIVPCHRVIGTNGKLTGYAGGLERKRWLLDFEIENDVFSLKG